MKIGEAFRLSPGADLSGKLLHIMEGVTAAFEKPLPSLNGQDFLIGVAGAIILRIAVYMKGKNAKKYRKGVEYGSARCLHRVPGTKAVTSGLSGWTRSDRSETK